MRGLMSVVLSATLISVGAQAATRVLEQKDLFRMQWAEDPQIRRDGAQIAYARAANDIMSTAARMAVRSTIRSSRSCSCAA